MSNRIIERIKKCLAHANNSNPHERATAIRQAQNLMAKHGLTDMDITLSEVKTQLKATGAGKKMPAHIGVLATMVADAFGAKMICRNLYKGGRWVGHVEFYGIGEVAEVCGYAFDVLRRQLKRDRDAYLASLDKRLKRSSKTRRGDVYAVGWVLTAGEQIKPRERSEKETSVMAAYEKERWPTPLNDAKVINRASKLKRNDHGALLTGISDGKKVQFYQGVGGAERQAALGVDK